MLGGAEAALRGTAQPLASGARRRAACLFRPVLRAPGATQRLETWTGCVLRLAIDGRPDYTGSALRIPAFGGPGSPGAAVAQW